MTAQQAETGSADPARSLSHIAHSELRSHAGALELAHALSDLVLEETGDHREARLRTLARHLPLAVWIVDDDLVIRTSYGRAMRRLGLRDGDLDGSPVFAWGEEGTEHVRRAVAGQAVEFESEGVIDGNPWAMWNFVVPHPDGGAIAVSVDATDRYLAHRELGVSEGRFQVLAESVPVGIFLADARGDNIYTNPELQRQLDRSAEETLGERWREAVHPDDLDVIEGWRRTRRPGEIYDVTYRVVRRDGDQRWLRVRARRVYDDLSEHVGYVGTTEDVTERRASEFALHASEERFRTIAESAPIGIFLSDVDNEVTYTNPRFAEILGRASAEIEDEEWVRALHPDDLERVAADVGALRTGDELDVQCRIVRPDGKTRWIHANAKPFRRSDDAPMSFVGTITDITDSREAQEQVREREEVTRAIVQTAAEGIVTVDEDGCIETFNAAAERIFRWHAEEIVGQSFGVLLPDPHREVYLGYLRSQREPGERTLSETQPRELPGLRKDGTTVPIELAVTEVHASGRTLFTGLVRDVSERREFERQLEHQATHDPLTSLPNRALLAAQLESALARAYRSRTSVAVLFVSLARVKVVTDSLGHRAGDELRVSAAHRLQGVVRPTDTVTRFGEDEFVVLAEDLGDVSDAVDLAQRIIEAMEVPFDLTVDEAFITCNVGISFAVDGLGTAESLIADADLAMFRAAEHGGGRFEIFDHEMRAWINERRKTEVALRHALERSEFELHYQPIMSLDATNGHAVKGFEALVRWNRGTLGLVSPGEFIPVAEESGLIIPMGESILRDACEQAAAWQAQHTDRNLTVSVNLSGRQLAQRNIAEVVQATLAETGADPAGLVLEITETVLLHDVEQAVRTLHALKDIGVTLSIDDFGTGYSSLTYLRRFPVDVVKIDRSFVSKLGDGGDPRDASIVRTVILLAEGLDLDVVAEGVETDDQLEELMSMNCRYAQGFHFARPRPVGETAELLA